MLAKLGGAFDDVDLAADELGRPGELFFEIDPVVDEQDLEILQVGRCSQHPSHENHGE